MTTLTCERCGYTANAASFEPNGCPRCAERAVRSQMRRFAARQATHLRSMRSRAGTAARRIGGSPQEP